MSMSWEQIHKIIRAIEENAERQIERGLLDASPVGIVNAQLALGCKRGMSELKHRISAEESFTKQAEAYKQQDRLRKQHHKGIKRTIAIPLAQQEIAS